jgi:hypothetical protein
VNWDTALANIEVTFGGPQAPAMALLFDDMGFHHGKPIGKPW